MTEELKCPVCSSELTDNTAFYLCQNAKCLKAWTPIALSQPVRWREVPIAGFKETDPNFIRAHEKAQKFIKEHPNVPVVDVPPVEQSDTVENVNNNRMLAGWGRYNYMECADKGSHDMRLAFIAGYKRALHDAQPQLCDPTADGELAELLNMLMATNVHGAILQLRDHLDGDKRLIDNYCRLYKRAEAASLGESNA